MSTGKKGRPRRRPGKPRNRGAMVLTCADCGRQFTGGMVCPCQIDLGMTWMLTTMGKMGGPLG